MEKTVVFSFKKGKIIGTIVDSYEEALDLASCDDEEEQDQN